MDDIRRRHSQLASTAGDKQTAKAPKVARAANQPRPRPDIPVYRRMHVVLICTYNRFVEHGNAARHPHPLPWALRV